MQNLREIPDLKDHSFLAEEVLQPMANRTDGSRGNMFASSIVQTVVPLKTQLPLIFTRFENQVGEISSSYRIAEGDWELVHIAKKNELNALYFFHDHDADTLHMIEQKPAHRCTESYAYAFKSVLPDLKVGDTVEKGTPLIWCTAYDGDLNFGYGRNLKTVYLPDDGLTYEDGITISESAAKEFAYATVQEVLITVNTNDILLNLYGDDDNYKAFPEIGEKVADSGVLCARRRVRYETAATTLSDSALKQVNHSLDSVFSVEGTVIDIDVFSNTAVEDLEKHKYNEQIVRYLKDSQTYEKDLIFALEEVAEGDADSMDDRIPFVYQRAKESLDDELRWSHENDFDGVVVRIKVLYEKPIGVGSKITNRYGGKGVISKIRPDHEMPRTLNGEYADVCYNPGGTFNRINVGQLYELTLNGMSRIIRDKMSELPPDEAADVLLDYVSKVNRNQATHMGDFYRSLDEGARQSFIASLVEEGIPLHQSPFYDNITLEEMIALRDEMGYEKTEFEGIQMPLEFGEIYFQRLKHDPFGKFSARSSRYVSMRETPSKNNRKYKGFQETHSTTPVRVGEQETVNLLVAENEEETYRFLRQYSGNKDSRTLMHQVLLTGDVFDLQKIPDVDTPSQPSTILKSRLYAMGLKLEK